MKSSRSINPNGTVQSWLPSDLVKNILDAAVGKDASDGQALFSSSREGLIAEKSSGNLLKADIEVKPAAWMPGDFGSIQTERTSPKWQPAVRYHTPANAADAATQIILDARRQADEIVKTAEDNARSIQEQAYQDGWNASMSELQAHFTTARSLVQELYAWREELMQKSESMILDLVKNIAQKLFGEGFSLDASALQLTFTNVLDNARSLGNLRVYVNPDDATLLGPYWREFQESISNHQIEIIPSNSISRGGCYVNGQWGSADGRIETQLKAIMDALTPEENENTEKGEA